MVRSYWKRTLVSTFTWAGLALGQQPAAPPAPTPPTAPADQPERTMTVQEMGKPPLKCRILKSWKTAEGTNAYQVQALTTGDPGQFLSQASAIAEMDQSSGVMVSTLSRQVEQALRDKETAQQQIAAVNALEKQMDGKKKLILAKIDKVNSAAMKQAMAIFEQTGQYPKVTIPTANTVGAQALQAAISRLGYPYIWGAAGPTSFDCSGLVMWAYQQVGISLPHFTVSQYNSGVHVSRNDLEPGDLVFFFPNISHVGMYIGNGMMIDAPNFGEDVKVQPIYWNEFVGAVRIA